MSQPTYQFTISLSESELGFYLVAFSLISLTVTYLLASGLLRSKDRSQSIRKPIHSSETKAALYAADEDAVALSRKNKKRLASYPPGFPEGWYPICFADELKAAGAIKYVECLGLELATYRGEDGKARTLDAHCTHLGANLAIGGKVVGNCIECPFHCWRFDGANGNCTEIPYCETIPSLANTRHWETVEHHGLICIFYSPVDERRLQPPYQLELVPEIVSGAHVARGRRTEFVHMHIQEFAENSVDFQHFDPLHGGMTFPFTDIGIPYIRIRHEARWEPDEKQHHIARFHDIATLLFCGKEIPHSSAKATITFIGPGGLVVFRFVTELGNIDLFQTHTPIDRVFLRVSFSWFADKRIPSFLVAYVVGNWISQWRRDVMIWENKVYLKKPVLVKGDGPVMKLRRWFSQFYPESQGIDW